jgi:IS1 transposase
MGIVAPYRQCTVTYTDFWQAYGMVLPSKRHHAVGKETGKTSYIERFNCTLRQRVARLVRKTLSFSKKVENPLVLSGFLSITTTHPYPFRTSAKLFLGGESKTFSSIL